VLTTDDLVTGDDCFFVATGITDGELLRGVRYRAGGATTHSLVMRSRSGTIRGRVRRRDLVKAFLGKRRDAPYTISDMAADGMAVLDHLGIERADICGMSMGGMIVQTMALEHPDRVRSVTSVMSTTGSRRVGWQHPSLIPRLLKSPGRGREAYADATATFWSYIGSPGYPSDLEEVRTRALETYDRGISASGVLRQMMAILTQPNRTRALAELPMPATIFIEQNFGPHIEQNCAVLNTSCGSVSSCIRRAGLGVERQANCSFQSKAKRAGDRASSRSRAPLRCGRRRRRGRRSCRRSRPASRRPCWAGPGAPWA
jgi:hypothetical protein